MGTGVLFFGIAKGIAKGTGVLFFDDALLFLVHGACQDGDLKIFPLRESAYLTWLIKFSILRHMVNYQPSLDRVFAALSDPTRRAILSRLVDGRKTVGELAEPFEISPSGFSKHLRVLERAGLLRQHKHGRQRHCEAVVEPIGEVMTWLEQYQKMWNASLDSFAKYAEELQGKRKKNR